MSIFSHVESGTTLSRTMLPSFNRKGLTGTFFTLYPTFTRHVLPGDIWNIDSQLLVRLQPLLSPNLTEMTLRHRWFFVPLRQVEPNTELIVTGSTNGVLADEELPVMDSVFKDLRVDGDGKFTVVKDSILNVLFGILPGKYVKANVVNSDSAPAAYWVKAIVKIWFDYYRDENLPITLDTFMVDVTSISLASCTTWEAVYDAIKQYLGEIPCLPVLLPKDYFSSSLPWILKGTSIPSIDLLGASASVEFDAISNPGVVFGTNGSDRINMADGIDVKFSTNGNGSNMYLAQDGAAASNHSNNVTGHIDGSSLSSALEEASSVAFGSDAFLTMEKLRDISAMTRVFERLARAGSRYTEYLRANFGTAPADETLQRPRYLGGFKQQILTTEVVQTAGAGDNPVGTMRGHGISFGGKSLNNAVFKEFGMLIGLTDIRPKIQYTQGINREFTYKKRFDFFNPSFQHLSEQEVRSGEIFFDDKLDSNGNLKNDIPFGFQGMYNELRTGSAMFIGELGDGGSMSYWNQALHFDARPELDGAFLNGRNHLVSFLRPFGMSDIKSNPIILDCGFSNKPFRPMVRNATPGLTDHL